MTISRRRFTGAVSATLASPALMSRAFAQGATIKIGMCSPVTGPAAEQGRYAQTGARLAMEAINKAGGVLGRQMELIIEDDQVVGFRFVEKHRGKSLVYRLSCCHRSEKKTPIFDAAL